MVVAWIRVTRLLDPGALERIDRRAERARGSSSISSRNRVPVPDTYGDAPLRRDDPLLLYPRRA